MRRRALLSALAATSAGLAGCAFGDGDPAGDRTTTDRSPPTDATDTPGDTETTHREDDLPEPEAYASVIELATVRRTYAFAPTRFRTDDGAEVTLRFDRTATADHPARLRGWLRNGNDFPNTFRVGWIPAVGRVHGRPPSGTDYDASLHLVPTANNDLAERAPAVARTDAGRWYARGTGPRVTDTRRLAPGEHVELAYHLVGERARPDRPTGVYQFRGDDETARVTVWDTASPGPATTSRFAGRSLPAFEDRTVAWYHEADRTTPAFVRPGAERRALDGLVTFEMVNNSHETLQCGHWNLHKLVDGRWYHVAPLVHTADCRALHPGDRLSWSLRAFNGAAVDCGDGCCGGEGLTAGSLGGGEYAVVAGYGTPADASGALVELVGDPVTVRPTADAAVDRDGEVVTVQTDRHGDGERPPDATLMLTRTDGADERVIAEQVMRTGWHLPPGRALRNALAAIEPGVRRVVVRTDERVAEAATGGDADGRRFRFRGQAYEIRHRGLG